MRRPNDIGGHPAGPVDIDPHEPEMWQKRLSALVSSLGPASRGIMRIDEFRRAREDLAPELYARLSYFELWTHGIVNLLIEKGVLARDEIEARMAQIKDRG